MGDIIERDLKCIGVVRTPNGLERMWDTGIVASPTDLAESMGFQTAIANARNHHDRYQAKKRFAAWLTGFSRKVGVYAPGAFVGMADDGRILVNRPRVQIIPPEEWPEPDDNAEVNVQVWSHDFEQRLP